MIDPSFRPGIRFPFSLRSMALPQTRLQLHLRPQQETIYVCVLNAHELSLQAPLQRLRSAFRPRRRYALLRFNSPPPLQPRRSRIPLILKTSHSSSSMERTSVDIVSLDQYCSVLNPPSTPRTRRVGFHPGPNHCQQAMLLCQLCLRFLMRFENY